MTNAYAARVRGRRAVAIAAKRDRVRELYELNHTDERIAELIGIERSSVTKLRNQMGLLPKWAGRNGVSFTPRQDTDLLELKRDGRLTWPQIALLIDNLAVSVVCQRYQLLLTTHSRGRQARTPETISCRRCKQCFVTPNRRQVQMCDGCHKQIEAMGSAYDF